MSQPVVIGGPPAETALLKECIQTWIDRLAEPGLVERAVFFNKAAYSDLRNIPEDRPIDFSQSHTWETVKEDYAVAIPIGSSRRAGMESSFTEPLLSIALDELGKRPTDFPNLRHVPSEFGLGEDLWWGEEISDLWAHRKTTKDHWALGLAFGYREDRISEQYPRSPLRRVFRCLRHWLWKP